MSVAVGQQFRRLTAQERVRKHDGHAWRWMWRCACSCGGEVTVRGDQLARGETGSCGCLRVDTPKQRRGPGWAGPKKRTPEYLTWCAMKDRCLNPNSGDFANYGRRGITVCQRWSDSFEAFLEDMGPRPRCTTIDRMDGAGNYEPGNCRWATAVEQGRNRRGVKLNDAAAASIRMRLAAGERQAAVAADLGVCEATVSRVWRQCEQGGWAAP